MEVYTEQIIDIALDAAGYVIAGGIWLLVYSAWQNRRAARAAGVTEPTPAPAPRAATQSTAAALALEGKRSLEFVAFRGATGAAATASTPPEISTAAGGDRRRNRAEVFALARRMLEQGASTETVKSELPVSDGELALLHGKY